VTMTKRELVIRVANQLGMTQSDVAKIIEGALDMVSHSLAEGHRWELRDFGVFETKTRAARVAQNPKTLERVKVPAKRTVKFKIGRLMRARLCDPASKSAETK
jgi:nucleoid DNA-binding protein